MDIEAILEMYEDDYNPSSKVPGPRNMYNQGQLVQPNVDGSRPGYSGENYNKDKTALDADTIKKIKQKIKLPVGQKWSFYDPNPNSKTYNPKGQTYGIKKANFPKLYDVARNVGKEGRAETKLKKATEKYQEIKADPKLLAEKKLIKGVPIRNTINKEVNTARPVLTVKYLKTLRKSLSSFISY